MLLARNCSYGSCWSPAPVESSPVAHHRTCDHGGRQISNRDCPRKSSRKSFLFFIINTLFNHTSKWRNKKRNGQSVRIKWDDRNTVWRRMSRKSFQERGLLGTLSSSERMNSALVQLCVDRQQLVKSEPGPRGEDQSEGVVLIPSFLLVDPTLSATQKHTHN